jgi:hypothetical protein
MIITRLHRAIATFRAAYTIDPADWRGNLRAAWIAARLPLDAV